MREELQSLTTALEQKRRLALAQQQQQPSSALQLSQQLLALELLKILAGKKEAGLQEEPQG